MKKEEFDAMDNMVKESIVKVTEMDSANDEFQEIREFESLEKIVDCLRVQNAIALATLKILAMRL